MQLLTVAHLLNSKVRSVGYEEYDQGTKQQKGEHTQSNIYLIKTSIAQGYRDKICKSPQEVIQL